MIGLHLGIGLRTVASGVTLFTPAALASVAGWYDADTLSGADASSIASFTDLSGNSKTFANVSSQPTLRTNVLNGRKVARFVASTGDNLQNANVLIGATAGSLFAVIKVNNDPPATTAASGGALSRCADDTNDVHFPHNATSTIFENFGSTVRRDIGNPTPSLASWRIYSAHSASGDWRAYLDGTLLYSTATNTVGFGATARYMGGFPGASLDGDLAAMILCNSALTTLERQKTEGYLAWRFGLQANLPGGHPYASAAP